MIRVLLIYFASEFIKKMNLRIIDFNLHRTTFQMGCLAKKEIKDAKVIALVKFGCYKNPDDGNE